MLSLILPALIAMQAQPEAPQHRVENVRGGVYCIYGPGGNVGIIDCGDHLVMIDGQFERSLPGLLEAVKGISDKPIKFLVNTHHHGDHVGSNRALAEKVQGIVAHINVRSRMAKAQEGKGPDETGGLPDMLLGYTDSKMPVMLTMAKGQVEWHAIHFARAHTDNDIAVGIPGSKVIHMGDMLFLGQLPFIDIESGGDFDGLEKIIGHILTWLPEDSLIIPGHGSVCGKKELARHHAFLQAIQQHAQKNPEMAPAELAESFDKEPWEDKKPSPQFVTWETLFQVATGKGSGRVQR